MHEDLLMQYATAMEIGDLERLAAILKIAETNPGLDAAIATFHNQIDLERPLPEHLLAIRNQG